MDDYITTATIASWFKVNNSTVQYWLHRYKNFPKPDLTLTRTIGTTKAWKPEREAEIREWYSNRPGQGARTDITNA